MTFPVDPAATPKAAATAVGRGLSSLPSLLSLSLLLLLLINGCGLREPQTGSLRGRVLDNQGDLVVGAEVYSLFAQAEKVLTGNDGVFYLSELPAGNNTIVIRHPDYAQETRIFQIRSSRMTEIEEIRLDQANAPRRIDGLAADTVTSSTAVITWETYKPLLCQVQYGTSLSYDSLFEEHDAYTEHRITLSGLSPETVYHLRVRWLEDDQVWRFSHDIPFKTERGASPAAPPNVRITGLPALGSVDIAWDTATSTAVTGYFVSRAPRDGPWTNLTSEPLARTARAFRDESATAGVFYRYAVQSLRDDAAISERQVTDTMFIPGFINTPLHLTAADSPIILHSDLIIGVGAELTVTEGVEFRIAARDLWQLGMDPDRVEILVHGRISLQGSAADPIRFTMLDGISARDHWAGLRLREGRSGNSILEHVQLSGCAEYAIRVDEVAASLRDITLRKCGNGIGLFNIRNLPSIERCSLTDIAGAGFYVEQCRRLEIFDCTLTDVTRGVENLAVHAEDRLVVRRSHIEARDYAIGGHFQRSLLANNLLIAPNGTAMQYNAVAGTDNVLDHCTLDAMIGIQISAGAPVIENNLISSVGGNGTVGISYAAAGAPEFGWNNIDGFAVRYEGCAAGQGAGQLAADFVGGHPYDYHLQPASPLRSRDINGQELGRYGPSYK